MSRKREARPIKYDPDSLSVTQIERLKGLAWSERVLMETKHPHYMNLNHTCKWSIHPHKGVCVCSCEPIKELRIDHTIMEDR